MTPRRGGNMSGPIPEKTIGWLWGFLFGALFAGFLSAIAIWKMAA